MNKVWRRGQYLVNQIITGPQSLLLMLDMQPERIEDPFVSAIDVCPVYGKPDDAVVRAAVLKGTDEANAEFGTSWHPLEIRFSYSGYDNRQCRLAGQAGYNIVKTLAELGLVGIEQLPAEPAKPAEPKVAPDCGGIS